MTKEYTLASNCFNQLHQLIISGKLKPGDKLKGEYLKQLLKVGMSPIREALARLTTTRLVEFRDKVGFRVNRLTLSQVKDNLISHAKLECLLLKDAIFYGNNHWESQIMANLYSLSKIESSNKPINYSYWALHNDEFHNALLASATSETLWQLRNQCDLIKTWLNNLANYATDDKLITPSHSEHALLAKLCIERQNNQATDLLYRHLTKGIDQLTKILLFKQLINPD